MSLQLGAVLGMARLPSIEIPTSELQPQRAQPPVIIAFDVNDGARTVRRTSDYLTMSHRLTGSAPVEYRVSARPDFSGAAWRPYVPQLQLRDWLPFARGNTRCQGSENGNAVVLYFQVRAENGSVVRIVDGHRVMVPQMTESNVVTDSICALRESGSAPTNSA